jgi:uncharacterized phiE125 gp8 family phage protein
MIDLTAAKEHLKVETTTDDGLIAIYLAAAKAAVENATGKLLASAEVLQVVDGFPCRDGAIRLWKGPVSAIVSVEYDDSAGVEQTLTDYRLIEGPNARLLPAFSERWPLTAYGPGTVRITYTAGYASDEVPPPIDQAVLLLTGHYYWSREAVNSGPAAQAVELPLGVAELLGPYRAPGIA